MLSAVRSQVSSSRARQAQRAARRAAQADAQLAHLQAQDARNLEAERAAAGEREATLAELLKLRSVDAMRQGAHAREVKALTVSNGAARALLFLACEGARPPTTYRIAR